jgi:hypothetical protein
MPIALKKPGVYAYFCVYAHVIKQFYNFALLAEKDISLTMQRNSMYFEKSNYRYKKNIVLAI